MHKQSTYCCHLNSQELGFQSPVVAFFSQNCTGKMGFGFNGKEKDDEVTGTTGSHLDFGARMYDSRIGRWWGTDPFRDKYPAFSTYGFAANNPILLIDPNGKWIVKFNDDKTGIVFYKEPGDNLRTLSKQLGIRRGTIKKASPNIKSEISTQDYVLLSNLEQVKNINNYLSNRGAIIEENGALKEPGTNCASSALACSGMDYPIGRWSNDQGVPTTTIMASLIREGRFSNISIGKSRIGDIITYTESAEWVKKVQVDPFNEYAIKNGLKSRRNFDAAFQVAKFNSPPSHFQIELLRNDDGTPKQVLDKNGALPVEIKDGGGFINGMEYDSDKKVMNWEANGIKEGDKTPIYRPVPR